MAWTAEVKLGEKVLHGSPGGGLSKGDRPGARWASPVAQLYRGQKPAWKSNSNAHKDDSPSWDPPHARQ